MEARLWGQAVHPSPVCACLTQVSSWSQHRQGHLSRFQHRLVKTTLRTVHGVLHQEPTGTEWLQSFGIPCKARLQTGTDL